MINHRLPPIFLDRDGTLIREEHYLKDPRRVKLLPGVAAGLKRLRRAGFPLVVVSNQSGIARGIVSPRQLKAVWARFAALLRKQGAKVDGHYWCPHGPTSRCACRKPRPGMLKQAARELNIPWRGGISIGDKAIDVQLGQRSGGKGILVLSGYGKTSRRQWQGKKPDFIAKNFQSATRWILSCVAEKKFA